MSASPWTVGIFRLICVLMAACPLTVAGSFVHPFHLCVGQMKWNAETKLWEVSLRLHPQDLEKALSAELKSENGGSQIGVDDANFPEIAIKYLNAYFYAHRTPLTTKKQEFLEVMESLKKKSWAAKDAAAASTEAANAERSSLKWIGMEQERGWLWMHFEMTAPSFDSEKEKLWFVNRILIDSTERQENTLAIDPVVTKKFSLQFRSGEEFQEMKPTK